MGDDAQRAGRAQVRGSSLLLVGRILATVVSFATQVLVVRHLSKNDYGAFAFAVSVVNVAEAVTTLGLDRAVTRFVPMQDERRDDAGMAGTLAFVSTAIVVVGTITVVAVLVARGPLTGGIIPDRETAALLGLLILLAPAQAIDNLMLGVFAVFARPAAIFFRRFALAPALRLGVVLAVVAGDGDARALATGYVVAGVAGVVAYLGVLFSLLRRAGVLRRLTATRPRVDAGPILAFTLPLMTSDLLFMVMEGIDVVLLGRYGSTSDVASLRAVQPVARLNLLVLSSFGVLFTPLAARLVARGDDNGVADLYWRSATWVALLTFPLFLVTFALAGPLTVALFGGRYAGSGLILGVLSFGFYLNAALGLNGLALNVFGRVRAVVAVNAAAAAIQVVLGFVLIPRFGAPGAAVATATTLVCQNGLRQWSLRQGTVISGFDRSRLQVYVTISAVTVAACTIRLTLDLSFVPGLALVATMALFTMLFLRRHLEIGDTLPELTRIPVLGRLLGR